MDATDSLILGLLITIDSSLIFLAKTLDTMLIYAHQFFKIRLVFHTPYLGNEVRDPPFIISETIYSLSVSSRGLKKIYRA